MDVDEAIKEVSKEVGLVLKEKQCIECNKIILLRKQFLYIFASSFISLRLCANDETRPASRDDCVTSTCHKLETVQVESPNLGDCQYKTVILCSPDPFSSRPNTKEEKAVWLRKIKWLRLQAAFFRCSTLLQPKRCLLLYLCA